MAKNFRRALKHLKSNHKTTKLDEKKQMLNEIPTMNMSGVYSKNPAGFRYDPPSPAKRFVPDIDGNWPSGVPGTPGATEYIRPQGYWVNDSDWDEFLVPDLRVDFTESTTNTDGFIDPETGTVKTLLPPNSRDFILGPLIDGYTYNHGYDDFTTIGYIQKDTRQIVVLGQISGHWDTTSTLPGGGTANRLWDGTASQFTSYNPKFTLAMAQWFKDKLTANDFTKNFPYFYSGGVPQSPLNPQPPGSPGGMPGGNVPGSGGGGNDPAGGPPTGTPTGGSGGSPDTGSETPQGDPEGTDPGGNNLWGMTQDEARSKYGHLSNEELAELGIVRNPDGTLREMTPEELKAERERQMHESARKAMMKIARLAGISHRKLKNIFDTISPMGKMLDDLIKGDSGVAAIDRLLDPLARAAGKFAGRKAFGGRLETASNVMFRYDKWLASGGKKRVDVSNEVSAKEMKVLQNELHKPIGKSTDWWLNYYQNTVKPGKIDYASSPEEALKIHAKYIQTKIDQNMTKSGTGLSMTFHNNVKLDMERYMASGGKDIQMTKTYKFASGGSVGDAEDTVLGQLLIGMGVELDRFGTGNIAKTMTAIIGSKYGLRNVNRMYGGKAYAAPGMPMRLKVPPLGNVNESIGSFTAFLNSIDDNCDFLMEDKNPIISEDKKKILREITQPLKEIKELPKTQKLEKYRPNFKGKYKAQNTPNVTASKKSDEMVKAKNAAGQTWRTKDKYWGGYESQERMNVVYDNVGHGDQYWDKIVNENSHKKNIKNRQVQEQLNIIAHEEAMRKLDPNFASPFEFFNDDGTPNTRGLSKENLLRQYAGLDIIEQETLDAPKDPLYKKVAKRLDKEIDYPNKPAAKGYPNDPPPKMVNGYHPKYGQRYKYDKLDPVSAVMMRKAPTGNPEIDANVEKASKKPKIKNLKVAPTDEKFDWRDSLEKKNLNEITMQTTGIYRGQYDEPLAQYADFTGKSFGGKSLAISSHNGSANGASINASGVAVAPDGVTIAYTYKGYGSYTPTVPGYQRGPGYRTHGSVIWYWNGTGYSSLEYGTSVQQPSGSGPGYGAWTSGAYSDFLSANGLSTDLQNLIAGHDDFAGKPVTVVLTKDDLGNSSFLPINLVKGLIAGQLGSSGQGFDWLKDKKDKAKLAMFGFGKKTPKKLYYGGQGAEDLRNLKKDVSDFNKMSPLGGGPGGVFKLSHVPEGDLLSEAIEIGHFDPEVLNVDINDIRKGIMPEFPKDPPPKMIDGYSEKSNLAPKVIKGEATIKITSKDLLKFHKLKKSEIDEFMNDIKEINDYLQDNPKDLLYVQERYPKDDPRLAELNWKMDQKLGASKEYMDKHFPENQKLYKKLIDNVKKNIELTGHKKAPKFEKKNFKTFRENAKRNFKDLQEQVYTNITTGMKVGQTFKHIPSGQTFTTGGALGGRETLPSTVSIFGDPTPAPDASSYPLQGYAKPMDMMRRKNREDLEDINARLDASQEFAKKVNSDVMMNARVSASPEAIQAAKQQSNMYIKQPAPGSYVPPVADSERNYGLTKDKIEIKDFVDALDKKSIITKEYGNKYTTLQRKMDEVGRGTSAAASIEKEIANLIDAEIAELDAVDQELDAVEKEKETPPPPLPEDEFPSEESPFDAMLPPEGGGGEGDEGTPTGGEDGFGDENPKDPNEPVPDPDDEKFLNKQQTLVNLTKGLNQIGLPNDFAQWTINYAKGDMTPINKFSRGMERQVRDLVLDKFNKNPNAKTVNINYNDYGYRFKALPTRLGMGRFKATKLDNGKIRVQDTFNVNKDFTNIGSASIVPGLQKTADRLVDISYKNRNIKGREDKGGITIDVVIPGASAVKKYDKNKKRKVNESNTFSKVKKFKNKY